MYEINDQREKDILELCKQVLNTSCIHWDNPNGPYQSECPFCGELKYGGGGSGWPFSMEEITHELTCAYLIARDLSTGMLNL